MTTEDPDETADWLEPVSTRHDAEIPVAEREVPLQLGPYRVEGELGRGGMGVVHVATDERLGRRVALKMLNAATAEDAAAVERLEHEARLLASLNHPNIATVHSLESIDGFRFFSLELIDGVTLGQLVSARELSLGKLLDLFRQLAEAIQFAHDSGVVHCDLKPSNVLVDSRETVKVLDFGIARALRGFDSATARPAFGTPGYMSPEQIAGTTPDGKTDVWAFGCMLFEALAGKKTFGRDTVTATLDSTLRDDPDWDALPDSLPESIKDIVVRCLRRDPNARLSNLGEAAETLGLVAHSLRWQEADESVSRALARALRDGDRAPPFELRSASGELVVLESLLQRGPVVITFYRGVWCPICTTELITFQQRLAEIVALGASMVAISPQLVEHNRSLMREGGLGYDLLSDPGNVVAERYGVAFELTPDLRRYHRTLGVDLSHFNGDESGVLPMPATFVVDRDGTIRYAATSSDPVLRPDPGPCLRALRECAGSASAG